VLSAFADHSGDSNFELCYFPDFDDALDEFRNAGGPAAWLDAFHADENKKRRRHHRPLNVLAMAAHYSPNPASPHLGIDLPFELDTGAFRADVWERWRAWDPVNMVAHHVDALRKMRGIYVDCGRQDEFNLVWGARALVAKLRAHGLAVRYEEFDDGHMNIPYRYDRSLPFLATVLGGNHG
jgi:enterochelin esterase family protein